MAKLETTTAKKPKGKKRKHAHVEADDEVANKSIIVEANVEEIERMQINPGNEKQASSKKAKKRKNKEKSEILEKRSKSQNCDETVNEDFQVGNGHQEPTLEELKESEKPENHLAIVTGRQKKKRKHQKLLENQKVQSVGKDKLRNDEYLRKWKNARDSWKFEKLRQLSIQQTMFEQDKLDGELWPIALEYLAGSKGLANDKIVKLASNAIEELDIICEQLKTEQEKLNIVNSVKYQRARDLLQIFD